MGMNEHRTVPELFSDVINQLASLFRTEAQLARVELSEKMSKARAGLAMIVAAAILMTPALVILLQAAVAAMVEQGFQPALASLIVGGGTLLVGLVLAYTGFRALKPKGFVPQKTIDQLQHDAAVARRQVG